MRGNNLRSQRPNLNDQCMDSGSNTQNKISSYLDICSKLSAINWLTLFDSDYERKQLP